MVATLCLGTVLIGASVVSNLANSSSGNVLIGADGIEYAQAFNTGNVAGGYDLQFIVVSMNDVSGTPASLEVALFSDNSGLPGNELALLSGSVSPGTPGEYTYTPDTTFTLNSDTTYHTVLRAPGSGLDDFFRWRATNDFSETGAPGWSLANQFSTSNDNGANWNSFPTLALLMEVNASPIPEPSTYAVLCGILALCLVMFRRRPA